MSGDVVRRRAALRLDREWAGPGRPRPEAVDLAKSFLYAITPAGGPAHELAAGIEHLLVLDPDVMKRTPPLEAPALSSEAAAALAVVVGDADTAALPRRRGVGRRESATQAASRTSRSPSVPPTASEDARRPPSGVRDSGAMAVRDAELMTVGPDDAVVTFLTDDDDAVGAAVYARRRA